MRVDPHRFLAPISVAYRLWCHSMRFREQGREHLEAAAANNRRLVYATWHDELFPLVWHASRIKLRVGAMVSQSRDGELLAAIIESLGMPTIRGSSSKGGVRALVAAIRLIERQHHDVVITVDGPRGPRHQAKEGAIHLAAKTGAHIMPVRVYMDRAVVFQKAWDKFQLPWPFSKCLIVFGESYAIPDRLDADGIEVERARLEQRMESLGSNGGTGNAAPEAM